MSNIGNKKVFSKNLSFYIERKSITQKEVADAIGVSPSTLNEWVTAKKYPRIDKIEKLSNYFGIEKSDLIEDKAKRKETTTDTLTDGEKQLLSLFRQIPDDMKDVVIEMIRVSLKNRK